MKREEVLGRAERANAFAWTGFNGLQGLGTPFLAPNLMNTVLMRLGASDFVLGLFAINQLLALPAQVLAARVTDRSTRKVRLVWLATLSRVVPILLPIGVMALTGGQIGLWPFFAAAFIYFLGSHLSGAFGGVVQMDVLSRIFRPAGRGTILGVQGAVGGLAGALGGMVIAGLMRRLSFPLSYICAWSAGLVLVGAGSIALLRLRELPGLKARPAAEVYDLRGVLGTLAADRRFMLFMVAVVARMGFSAAQYYLWPAARRLHGLPDEYVGYLATLTSVVAMVVSPLIGRLADRQGRAATGLLFAGIAIAGFLLFPNAATRPLLVAAYILVIAGTHGIAMPLFLSVLDLSPPAMRGSYVAARYGIEAIAHALFLPLFGFASSQYTPHVVFYCAAGFCAVAGGVLFAVAEGRQALKR